MACARCHACDSLTLLSLSSRARGASQAAAVSADVKGVLSWARAQVLVATDSVKYRAKDALQMLQGPGA